jgi:hypothetical protein
MIGDSLETLILVQAQIIRFRQMAASGQFTPQVANRMRETADEVEIAARRADTEDCLQ